MERSVHERTKSLDSERLQKVVRFFYYYRYFQSYFFLEKKKSLHGSPVVPATNSPHQRDSRGQTL